MTTWDEQLARGLLATELPNRWAHSLGVARQARALRELPDLVPEILEPAAMLHDIGYASALVDTGFHALDGARYLRHVVGADETIVSLVAHHSCAAIEAEERDLVREMDEFAPAPAAMTDALIYCDMTTTPTGTETSVEDRLAEIVSRYALDSIVTRFIGRANPELRAAAARVEKMICS